MTTDLLVYLKYKKKHEKDVKFKAKQWLRLEAKPKLDVSFFVINLIYSQCNEVLNKVS